MASLATARSLPSTSLTTPPAAAPVASAATAVASSATEGVLPRLTHVAAERGPEGLAERLLVLQSLTQDDLAECEAVLASLPSDPAQGPSVVARSGVHLVALAGKRLRPLCVALAARAGQGF